MNLVDRINAQAIQMCQVIAPAPVAGAGAGAPIPEPVSLADGLTVEYLPLATPGLDAHVRYAVRIRDTATGKSVTMEGVPYPLGHRLGRITVWVRKENPESQQIEWTQTVELPTEPPSPASYWALQLVLWRPLRGVLLSGSVLDMAGDILAAWQAEAAVPAG